MKKHKKKFLIGLLIILVLGGLGFGGYKYYQYYDDTKLENKNWMNRHIALEENEEGVYEVNTINTNEDISIFNLVYQDTIENKIENLKDEGNYSLENPLIIYNPYGTASQSYYVYLGNSYDNLNYTISVDGYEDYEHDLGEDNEYQLIGFIPGKTNTLTISSNGESVIKEITTPDIKADVDLKLEETSSSDEDLTEGLYTVL